MAALKKRDVRPQTSSRRVSTASAASDADSPVLLLKILPYLDLAVQLRKIHLKLTLERTLLWSVSVNPHRPWLAWLLFLDPLTSAT